MTIVAIVFVLLALFLSLVNVSSRTYFCGDTANMEDESKRVLAYLTEIEEAAEDVLSTKQQVINSSSITCVFHCRKW